MYPDKALIRLDRHLGCSESWLGLNLKLLVVTQRLNLYFPYRSTEEKKLMEREYSRMPKQGVGFSVLTVRNVEFLPSCME